MWQLLSPGRVVLACVRHPLGYIDGRVLGSRGLSTPDDGVSQGVNHEDPLKGAARTTTTVQLQQQQSQTAPAAMQHNQQGGQQHGLLESDGSTAAALIPQSSPTGSVTDGSVAEESACDASLHEELRQLREACARNADAEEEVQRLRVCLAESHKQNLELRHNKAVFSSPTRRLRE